MERIFDYDRCTTISKPVTVIVNPYDNPGKLLALRTMSNGSSAVVNVKSIDHIYEKPSNKTLVTNPYSSNLIPNIIEYKSSTMGRNNHIDRQNINRNQSPNNQNIRPAKSLGVLDSRPIDPTSNLLTDHEVHQIESFYSAHKTFVYVSKCLANLYFTKTDLVHEGRISSPRSDDWQLKQMGIPVVIFDKGETKARTKRQLRIVLAERGTGFTLWEDLIDNLTDYKATSSYYHTLYLSVDHRKMAGLSFDCAMEATKFLKIVDEITGDPNNIKLSMPKCNRKEKTIKQKKMKPPIKREISGPCVFQHITSVDLSCFNRFVTLSNLVNHRLLSDKSEIRSLNSLNSNTFTSSPSPVASTASNSSMTASSVSENCSNSSI